MPIPQLPQYTRPQAISVATPYEAQMPSITQEDLIRRGQQALKLGSMAGTAASNLAVPYYAIKYPVTAGPANEARMMRDMAEGTYGPTPEQWAEMDQNYRVGRANNYLQQTLGINPNQPLNLVLYNNNGEAVQITNYDDALNYYATYPEMIGGSFGKMPSDYSIMEVVGDQRTPYTPGDVAPGRGIPEDHPNSPGAEAELEDNLEAALDAQGRAVEGQASGDSTPPEDKGDDKEKNKGKDDKKPDGNEDPNKGNNYDWIKKALWETKTRHFGGDNAWWKIRNAGRAGFYGDVVMNLTGNIAAPDDEPFYWDWTGTTMIPKLVGKGSYWVHKKMNAGKQTPEEAAQENSAAKKDTVNTNPKKQVDGQDEAAKAEEARIEAENLRKDSAENVEFEKFKKGLP